MPNPSRPFPEASRAPSVFLSYSHKDEVWKDRLKTHLGVLEAEGHLDTWDDRRIEGGADWFEEIQEAMARASVAILLVSADFLTSRFVLGEEVPKLLHRRAKEGLPVIPVMVRACAWKRVPWLAKIQARPTDDKTLAGLEGEGGDRCDAALATITEEILALLEKNAQAKTPFRESELSGQRDDFLDRVEAVCRLREPEAEIQRYPGIGDAGGYLRVLRRVGTIRDMYPVGAIEHGLSHESFQSFLTEIDAPYRKNDQGLISYLVYGGAPATASLVAEAGSRRVHLVSFVEYQGLIDFRAYLGRQTGKLTDDRIYPPRLYVTQRMRTLSLLNREDSESADALAQVREWLDSPHGRFLVLLGDFGTGKTFLLHELARRMGEDNGGLVPILLQMRSLEKGRSLDALLAQHFAQEGMEVFSPAKFRYMLEQGRIALLFDGFDELALRVTYTKAADHFATLLQAATGSAKVVLTSRRQHFLSESQVKTALAERVESLSGHRLAILQQFDREQVRLFLVNFFKGDEARAEARLDLIDRVKDLLGLSANPRLLGFIAELPEDQLVAASKGGEITAAKLYELLLTRWLEYEFDRVHPKGAPSGLSVEERWQAVTLLAIRLWQKTDRFVSLSDLSDEAARVVQAVGPAAPDAEVAAFQVASGTLLVRDDEGNFAFLHQSILEWLVAKRAVEALTIVKNPEALEAREISPLMADFFASLAGREQAIAWARNVLTAPASKPAKKNALLVLERQKVGVLKTLDLTGQNLRGQDFSGQDLSGVDLSGADLTEARLVGTRLKAGQMIRTTFREADLEAALLNEADLTEADFTGARLLGADLRASRLTRACFRRSKLLGAQLDTQSLATAAAFGTAVDLLDFCTRSGSDWGCNSVAWSPDGELLASAAGWVIRLWEARSGREIRALRGHENTVSSVAFSSDGNTLASGSYDKTVRLWQVDGGRELKILRGHRSMVMGLAFSPDGRLLASSSRDHTVRLWQVDGGRCTQSLIGHKRIVCSVAFSPEGEKLASGSADKTVRLWEIESGQEVWAASGHQDRISSVAFSPNGKLLASGSADQTIRLWQLPGGLEARTLTGHQGPISSVAFSPDGEILASGSEDRTIRLWQVESGREYRVFSEHQRVTSVSFSANGESLASGDDYESIHLREIETDRHKILHGNSSGVASVAFSSDGKTLASAAKGLRLWQVESARELGILSDLFLSSLSFNPDGSVLAGASSDHTIRLWRMDNGREIHILNGHQEWVTSVAFSPDGKTIASGSEDMTIRLWDAENGSEIRVLHGHRHLIACVRFSPDGKILASSDEGQEVRFWQVDQGNELRPIKGHRGPVLSVAFSPDGSFFASGSGDKNVRLWQLGGGRERRILKGHKEPVFSVAFTPDSKVLASGSMDQQVRLWQVDSGREIQVLEHQGAVWSVAFSPNGKILASGSSEGIRLWNVADGRCLAILLPLPEGWVAYAPDGRYKFGGIPAGGFWHAANLCRFEIGELDEWVPGLRLADDASFFDLPPWKPEIRVPERIAKAREGRGLDTQT